MSNDAKSTGGGTPHGAIIRREPPTVEELAEREGLDPVEKLRREFENKLALQRRDIQIETDVTLYLHLRNMRRKLRASTKVREDLQRTEKQQLAEVERDMEALRQRIPPTRLKAIE